MHSESHQPFAIPDFENNFISLHIGHELHVSVFEAKYQEYFYKTDMTLGFLHYLYICSFYKDLWHAF